MKNLRIKYLYKYDGYTKTKASPEKIKFEMGVQLLDCKTFLYNLGY